MNILLRCAAVVLLTLLAGCSNPDSVLFVTDTSIGINVDTKPPTASIAYESTNGFIGPRYQNGGIPPVYASLKTGGNVFAPKVSQVYATGAAATKAAGTPDAKPGPSDLEGDPKEKRLVFFGTTTTLGLKVGFGEQGLPDSLVFGYKRKELSFIPLGSTVKDGVATDVYPSALASINVNVNDPSLRGLGLDSQQFFSTGQAAETLAVKPQIRGALDTLAQESILASLTPQQQEDAQKRAEELDAQQTADLVHIMDAVAPNGTLDPGKVTTLVKCADQAGAEIPQAIKEQKTAPDLRKQLRDDLADTKMLAEALKCKDMAE
jgi:hypothetical protein